MFGNLSIVVAALAGLAQAVQFTSNVTGRVLTKGKVIELDWSTVDTDPATLSIYLVNFVQWPPLTYSLGEDLDTFKGKAWVRIPCDVDSTSGYQFNAINGTNTYVIYAQTGIFSLQGNCTEPPPTNTVETVTIKSTPTEICSPRRKFIYEVDVKIWFINTGFVEVATCDATSTKTITAAETCTVTETVDLKGGIVKPTETVTVTVVGGTVCPMCPGAPGKPSSVPFYPSMGPVPVYPVTTASKNVTVVKPTSLVTFHSGAGNVRSGIVVVAGMAAVVAALVM